MKRIFFLHTLLSFSLCTFLVPYSLIQQDISIMVNAFFQLTTSGLIVALKLAHKARIQKQGGFPQDFDSCDM